MEAVLGVPFLTLSDADIRDSVCKEGACRRSYTTAEALPTKRVELIDRRDFAAAALDKDEETLVVDVACMDKRAEAIHSSHQAPMVWVFVDAAPAVC